MSERFFETGPQPPEQREKGRNTEVRITFVRHAQKTSPKVFEQNLAQISRASISEKGAEQARELGRNLREQGRVATKGYRTPVNRTLETLQEIFSQMPAKSEKVKETQFIGEYLGFKAAEFSPETTKRYNTIMGEAKEKYLAEKFPGRNFDDLILDEQTEVAEVTEEPALQWYLDHDQTRPDPNTPSPYEAGSVIAYKLNRFINVADRMPSGKALDILTVGHKTSTEAFLKYCLVQETAQGRKVGFDRLEEIGGSMGLLDNWEIRITNDDQGNRSMRFFLRGREYGIDLDKIREMAEVGRRFLGKEEQAIDIPIK
ncbi:MAG: histidine phosphatase family protein [Patescibacteria group bacterium]